MSVINGNYVPTHVLHPPPGTRSSEEADPDNPNIQVFKGNYGGGDPGFTPAASAAMAYDLDSPFQTWKWNGTAWE